MLVHSHKGRDTQKYSRSLLQLFLFMLAISIRVFTKKLHQALPSLRTIQHIAHAQYKTINEGEFNFDGLANHLAQHKASNIILLVKMPHM